MGSVPSNVGVFFGKANRKAAGWYWTEAAISQKRKALITGPFETKEQAVENAAQRARRRQGNAASRGGCRTQSSVVGR